MHIRLTSVLDNVVEDWIPRNTGGQGKVQFAELTPDPEGASAGALPLTPDYPGECSETSQLAESDVCLASMACPSCLSYLSVLPARVSVFAMVWLSVCVHACVSVP